MNHESRDEHTAPDQPFLFLTVDRLFILGLEAIHLSLRTEIGAVCWKEFYSWMKRFLPRSIKEKVNEEDRGERNLWFKRIPFLSLELDHEVIALEALKLKRKKETFTREEERHKPRQLFFFHNLFGCAEAVSWLHEVIVSFPRVDGVSMISVAIKVLRTEPQLNGHTLMLTLWSTLGSWTDIFGSAIKSVRESICDRWLQSTDDRAFSLSWWTCRSEPTVHEVNGHPISLSSVSAHIIKEKERADMTDEEKRIMTVNDPAFDLSFFFH